MADSRRSSRGVGSARAEAIEQPSPSSQRRKSSGKGGRGKKMKVVVEEDEDEEEGEEEEEEEANKKKLPQGVDAEKLTKDLVRYVLANNHGRIPIQNTNINKIVMKGHNTSARYTKVIIAEANKILKHLFGMTLEIIENKSNKYYILKNLIQNRNNAIIEQSPGVDASRTGVLFVILSLILMREDSIAENELLSFLEKLGISGANSRDVHPLLDSSGPALLSLFEKQRYLLKITNKKQQEVRYRWGSRANAEVSDKVNMIKLMAKIYDTEPDSWIRHYKRRKKEEQRVLDKEKGKAAS